MRRLSALFLAALCSQAPAEPLQSHDAILETARRFIATRHPWQGMETAVTTGQLDKRTRLRRCDTPLEAFLPPGGRVSHRTTVGVRCNDPKGWKLYTPVTVAAYAQVLVATRPIPPGTALSAGDVQRSRRDIASLGYGYVDSLDREGGYRTRMSIAQGAVITPAVVAAAVMVRRGQSVQMNSAAGAVTVSMAGEAMADGALGERIPVRNKHSGTVVEGIVRSAEMVEIAR